MQPSRVLALLIVLGTAFSPAAGGIDFTGSVEFTGVEQFLLPDSVCVTDPCSTNAISGIAAWEPDSRPQTACGGIAGKAVSRSPGYGARRPPEVIPQRK